MKQSFTNTKGAALLSAFCFHTLAKNEIICDSSVCWGNPDKAYLLIFNMGIKQKRFC